VSAEEAGLGQYRLTADGEYQQVRVRIESTVAPSTEVRFTSAIKARGDVVLGPGSLTDSYDSRLGTYESQLADEVIDGPPHADSGGDIAANGSVTLMWSFVHGDARPGPGRKLFRFGDTTVTGTTDPLPSPLEIPDPPLEDFLAAHAENDNFAGWDNLQGVDYDPENMSLYVGGGNRLTLTSGTYFFSSITLEGNSQLAIDGPVTIYVTGNVRAAGGHFLNEDGVPADLQIIAFPYSIPGVPEPPDSPLVEFTGGSQSRLAVYAPAHYVVYTGHQDSWGSIVGKSVFLLGTLHYDVALEYARNGQGEFVRFERVAWRELSAR
jgi:hypothetical protein